jgi:hypothetical protein
MVAWKVHVTVAAVAACPASPAASASMPANLHALIALSPPDCRSKHIHFVHFLKQIARQKPNRLI